METVNMQTSDGVVLFGDWSVPDGAKRAMLLLHMMPSTRESWAQLSNALNEAGVATLAIDLRGHGESTQQGPTILNYKEFEDKNHMASRLDVDAAVNFLKSHGFAEEQIGFVGASIGANLSLDALTRYSGATNAVLLSPGLNYKGIVTDIPMKTLASHQRVAIYVTEGDEYSAQSARELNSINSAQTTLTVFDGAEHGTNILPKSRTGGRPTDKKNGGRLVPEIVMFVSS